MIIRAQISWNPINVRDRTDLIGIGLWKGLWSRIEKEFHTKKGNHVDYTVISKRSLPWYHVRLWKGVQGRHAPGSFDSPENGHLYQLKIVFHIWRRHLILPIHEMRSKTMNCETQIIQSISWSLSSKIASTASFTTLSAGIANATKRRKHCGLDLGQIVRSQIICLGWFREIGPQSGIPTTPMAWVSCVFPGKELLLMWNWSDTTSV